jgi:hypothetical protein
MMLGYRQRKKIWAALAVLLVATIGALCVWVPGVEFTGTTSYGEVGDPVPLSEHDQAVDDAMRYHGQHYWRQVGDLVVCEDCDLDLFEGRLTNSGGPR